MNLQYEISYADDGEGEITEDILAILVKGHGHSLEDLELCLNTALEDDPYLGYEGDSGPCGWNIREDWVRKIPYDHYTSHVFTTPGRGATPVTVLEINRTWRWWCINHSYEPATSGYPASMILAGAELVSRRLQELELDIDPRYDVRCSPSNESDAYVYMCRECSDDFNTRRKEAIKEAMRITKESTHDPHTI